MAVTNNFTYYKGEDVRIDFTMSDPLLDIAGWTIHIYLRTKAPQHSPTPGALLADNDCLILTTLPGTFRARLTAANNTQVPGSYDVAVWRIDTGFETPLSIGTATILAGVRV